MTKQPICKSCRQPFTPTRPLQKLCGALSCTLGYAALQKLKREALEDKRARQADRAKRQKLKTRTQYANEARDAVNAYVRARDARLGCVSCDRTATWQGQWHASHFRSVKAAPSLRFNLWNIHKSCSICNKWLSSNHVEYEPRLRAKIGDAKVDWLYAQNEPRRFSIEYLVRIKKIFTRKKKMLEKYRLPI